MSTPTAPTGVVIPTKGGEVQPQAATGVTGMKGGGMLLTPLPLNGGRKGRKTRRISKKVLKMLKKMPKKQLKKLMKGGVDQGIETEPQLESGTVGGRGKKSRKTKRHSLLY